MAINKSKMVALCGVIANSGKNSNVSTPNYDGGPFDNFDQIGRLDSGLSTGVPAGVQIATCILEIVNELDLIANPVPESTTVDFVSTGTNPADVASFSYSGGKNLILEWINPAPGNIQYFDLRVAEVEGETYADANKILKTGSTRVVLEPIASGETVYWIKGVDPIGLESTNAFPMAVNVTVPTTITVTPIVIDNNVLLYWTPSTGFFDIDYYKVEKGATLIGNITGTFSTVFEGVGGTFSYKITPYDVAGNAGATTTVSAVVSAPPDYELEDTLIDTALDGTATRVVVDGDHLLAPTVAETWTQHYTTNSKANIKGFTDADFTYWAEPSSTAATGTYVKIFDFGDPPITDMLLHVDYNYDLLIDANNVSVGIGIQVSDDNITYTSVSAGATYFAASVRYVKVTFTFTASSNKALIEASNFVCTLETKRVTDSGTIAAQASDYDDTNPTTLAASGTVVTFNKTFKDITSINLTVNSTTHLTPLLNFTDNPSPLNFKVLVFDADGDAVDANVYWIARGKV